MLKETNVVEVVTGYYDTNLKHYTKRVEDSRLNKSSRILLEQYWETFANTTKNSEDLRGIMDELIRKHSSRCGIDGIEPRYYYRYILSLSDDLEDLHKYLDEIEDGFETALDMGRYTKNKKGYEWVTKVSRAHKFLTEIIDIYNFVLAEKTSGLLPEWVMYSQVREEINNKFREYYKKLYLKVKDDTDALLELHEEALEGEVVRSNLPRLLREFKKGSGSVKTN